MTSFASIEALEPDWLWRDRILAGELTLCAGGSGIGKSFLAADLAARITTGKPMPDGTAGPIGSVILASAEDDATTATVWRLRAAGADLAKVHDAGDDITLPDSIPALRAMVGEIGDVQLVVIDPLSAVTSVALSSNVTVRRNILRPLQAFAKDTGVAVLLVHHLTKAGAIGGSQGLVDGVRSVLMVARDDADPRIVELSVHKTNVAAGDVKPLRYTLGGDWPETQVRWLWSESEATGPSQSRILMALHSSDHPLSPQELARLTKVPYATVRVLLHKLTRRGLVTCVSRGQYAPADENSTAFARDGLASASTAV